MKHTTNTCQEIYLLATERYTRKQTRQDLEIYTVFPVSCSSYFVTHFCSLLLPSLIISIALFHSNSWNICRICTITQQRSWHYHMPHLPSCCHSVRATSHSTAYEEITRSPQYHSNGYQGFEWEFSQHVCSPVNKAPSVDYMPKLCIYCIYPCFLYF